MSEIVQSWDVCNILVVYHQNFDFELFYVSLSQLRATHFIIEVDINVILKHRIM